MIQPSPGARPDRHRPLPHVTTWIFDLDNTLYSARYNLFDQIDRRIGAFISQRLGLDPVEARRLQKDYLREHGATLRGLMLNHGIDPGDFHDFVQDLDLSGLPPAPGLDAALARLDGRKLIFTNASTRHAERVMDRLGVAHHMDGIFDIADAGYVPKPHPDTYDTMIARHGVDARSAVMVEDMARNLGPAAALGMTTVWVRTASDWGREGADTVPIDHVIDDLADWLGGLVGSG